MVWTDNEELEKCIAYHESELEAHREVLETGMIGDDILSDEELKNCEFCVKGIEKILNWLKELKSLRAAVLSGVGV